MTLGTATAPLGELRVGYNKLSLVYRLNRDTNFAERAWLELQQVTSTNFHGWYAAHFLDTAAMTHACVIAYDWLYDYWTPAQRDTIHVAIQNKSLKQSPRSTRPILQRCLLGGWMERQITFPQRFYLVRLGP